MKKPNSVLLIVAASFLVACSAATETRIEQSIADTNDHWGTVGKPNVIFILVDDMGWDDVGYNGSEIATPNLDRMAAAGMRLDRNYVYPICSPTRAALLTGHNPLHYGIDGPISDDSSLPLDLKIMPEYFKELGYQTFMVGKWHLGIGNTDYWPTSRGFDSHYGFLGGFIDFYTHVYQGGLDWQREGVSVREEGHATDLFTAETKRLINSRDPDSPFFLYLAYNAPHSPLQTTPRKSGLNEEIEPGNRYVYAEMVTQFDDGIGQIISELEKQGILEDTIVVFSNDNGGAARGGASNGDLRGTKGDVLEGGTRVPGVIMWANHIAAGQVLEQQIAIQDWLPTLLDAVGSDSSRAENPYGQSMWPAIDRGVEVDRVQMVLGSGTGRAVFDWPWKLVRARAGSEHELYNVLDDPYERENLAQVRPKILASLETVLAAEPDVPSIAEVRDRAAGSREGRAGREGRGGRAGREGREGRETREAEIDFESREQETRSPWAEAAVRGSN